MPQASGNETKIDSSKQRGHRPLPTVESATRGGPGLDDEATAMLQRLGSGFSEATFGRHADLLGDPRMSHRMYVRQRAAIVQQLQRDYGNRYVQRLVKHIKQSRAAATSDSVLNSPLVRAAEQENHAGDAYEVSPDVATRIESQRNSGQPLDADTRRQMESSFGRDLADVRVHTGPEANQLNRQVHAEAFTSGNDVFLGEGNYSPDSPEGKELLAHELAHVVYQGGGNIRRKPADAQGETDEQRITQQADQLIQRQEEEETSDADIAAEGQAVYRFQREAVSTAFEIPSKSREVSSPTSSGAGVKTILGPGAEPQTFQEFHESVGNLEYTAHATVAPGGGPTVGATGNICTPSTGSAVLDWEVVSVDANNWGVNVKSLTLAGRLNVKPWPSKPAQMVVPNTANAVDGGNINNTGGSNNHWQAAINDMADYDAVGGGAGPNWHSTDASKAHEWAHWDQDYIDDSVKSAAGGNWAQTNIDLDALREPKASSPTIAAAKIALQTKVNTRMSTWRSATISRWNTLITTTDKPGKGGRGYAAGVAKLTTLIGNVQSYKSSKGW